MSSEKPSFDLSGFVQFVFDNADFNISTVTGHGTFHSLGGLVCTLPSRPSDKEPLRRPLNLSTDQNKTFANVMIKRNTKRANLGLSSITAEPLEVQYEEFIRNQGHVTARVMDLLWISNFGSKLSSPVPSWSGFMQIVNKEGEFGCTKIQILPFINLNPNDMSTNYTALSFAQKLCDRHKIAAAPVTFNQPLYIKAVDVIAACQPELYSLFARLGGFHWLMSALGLLGYVMGRSELDDVFKTVYAPGTVPHIMSGHAYSRAFQAHLLTSSALLFTLLDDESMIINRIDQSISKLLNDKLSSPEVGKDSDMLSMVNTITDIIDKNLSDSRTVLLWKL